MARRNPAPTPTRGLRGSCHEITAAMTDGSQPDGRVNRARACGADHNRGVSGQRQTLLTSSDLRLTRSDVPGGKWAAGEKTTGPGRSQLKKARHARGLIGANALRRFRRYGQARFRWPTMQD